MEHDVNDIGGLTESWGDEQQRRWHRNSMCKKQLQEGTHVQYKSGGNSLYPFVHANDSCLFEPVVNPDELKVNDIVFCEVQPGDRFFAHLIHKIEWVTWDNPLDFRRRFTIGDIGGHVDGYCFDEHIYGRLVEVVH